ncbi:uncharacterized protein LOC128954380 [Oppia nitens]|uniref:uncharacterized protein LOC128954380 n=1 Tax=Oppia nitens TaxID=1686743 RepID=UPI0023DAEC21|nr:uncharacterized protein LOC128954380 [Oppia nitens]
MTTAKDSFDRFGDDLCQLLLTYLPIDSRLRLQSVSKQWLALIFNTETHLVFDDKLLKLFDKKSLINNKKQTLNLFKSIVKKCPNITTVIINDFNGDYFKLLNNKKYCSRLTHISLKHIRHNFRNSYGKSFDLFCQRFGKQLQTFKINGYRIKGADLWFPKCMNSFRNLKTLDINIQGISMRYDVIFADNKLYSLPKTMKSFTLRLDNNSIKLFTKFTTTYGQQIKSLNLFGDDLNDENTFNTLTSGLSQMGQLKQLAISLPYYLVADQIIELLTTIGRRCRQLKQFSYTTIVSRIDLNQIFVLIAKHMSPQLRRLSVDCYHKYDKQLPLTSDSLKRLHRLTHLTLRVYNWQIIGNSFFSNIYRILPRLQYIHCDCVSINAESIIALGQLAHLTDVYLVCDQYKLITNESFLSKHLLIGSNIKQLFIKYWSSHNYVIKPKYFCYGNSNYF